MGRTIIAVMINLQESGFRLTNGYGVCFLFTRPTREVLRDTTQKPDHDLTLGIKLNFECVCFGCFKRYIQM